jgi:tripartite-type tricarboxylate transporter receptor subunit TctC
MIESGYPNYLLTFWTGVVAPAGTPPEFVAKVNAAINEGLKSPAMKQSLAKFNVEPNIGSPAEFTEFLAAEARKWAEIVKATNIKVE